MGEKKKTMGRRRKEDRRETGKVGENHEKRVGGVRRKRKEKNEGKEGKKRE